MGVVVVRRRGYIGSYFYKSRSIEELNLLNNIFSLIDIDTLQFITVSDVDSYGEYHPAKELKSIPELLGVVGNLAQEIEKEIKDGN